MENSRDHLTKDKLPMPIEDRTLKDAMQLFGKELLPRLGIEEKVTGVAPAEAVTSHIYGVDVVTSVLCTADVKSPMEELRTGINTYKIHMLHLRQCDADEKIRRVEKNQKAAKAERMDLIELLLTPLMSGKMSVKERIRRTLLILQKERDHLDETDYRRMGSILFAFAVKFLKKDEMGDLVVSSSL